MNKMEEDLKVFQKIDHLHLQAFRDAFPCIPIRNWSQSGADFELHVPKENEAFSDSEYYYKGELKFFHITPIRNLFSILNERAFRLYDLHSSADLVKSFGKPEWDRTQILPKGYFDTRPMIKIKAIHIHASTKLNGEEYYSLRGMLCESFRLNYGYEVEMDWNLFKM